MSKFCEMNGNINHIAEVSTSRVDGSPTGAKILTSTNVNTGDVRDTLDGKFKKMDDAFSSIASSQFIVANFGNWSVVAGQQIVAGDELKGYEYPDDSGDVYAVKGSVPLPITRPSSPDGRFYLASAANKTWVRDNFTYYVASRDELKTLDGLVTGAIVKLRNTDARYEVVSGTSPFPVVDLQSNISPTFYFKLLPTESTSYSYSFIGAGGKNDLTISDENSDVANELMSKIMAESPLIGGTIEMSGGQYWFSKHVKHPSAKHITFKGELSTLSYNTYESKTIIYTDNSFAGGAGGYVLDFDETQFMSLIDIGFRGELSAIPNHGAFFFGKKGAPTVGYGNALIERVNVHGYADGGLLQNCGISIIRDYQSSSCLYRGLALETSGDSCLYNIYCNTNNKDSTDPSILSGTGLFIGRGSNNTTILGGKLEFNSKGLVIQGSNGVTANIQYDYNSMANVIITAINDTNMACRGITLGGSRILSGGIVGGYEKASIYTDSTHGSVSVNMLGGTIRAAGDGAFDNSDSGTVGAQVGIYANGNDTYTNEVMFNGDGLYMGVAKSVVAKGSKTKVTIAGLLENNIDYDELEGASVITKQSFKGVWTPVFSGTSGTCAYFTQGGEINVIDGVATVNFIIQLSSKGSITGDVRVSGLVSASKSIVPPSLIDGVIGDIPGVARISGFISTGSTDITLYKTKTDGSLSVLNASDLTDSTLIRASIVFNV